MSVTIKNQPQRNAYDVVVRELRAIGFDNDLLLEDYKFGDWFVPTVPERTIPAAAFGQTPVSYDSALFGVALSNGAEGKRLVSQFRALGAPVIFEICDRTVKEWALGPTEEAISQIAEIPFEGISIRFAEQAADWNPAQFLRAKNIGSFQWSRQLELFADVLPELESHIQAKLSPMLRDAMAAASAEYRETSGQQSDPEKLFKLIFWILTGKVFRDREIRGFRGIEETDGPDSVLAAVARHYKQPLPKLLNRQTRDAAFSRIWSSINFRNLSVDVLAQLWSTSLVTPEVRKRLGIHRTPRSVAKYIVEQIEFEHIDDDHKNIVEPCCGSAVFLIAAMNRLRSLQWGVSSRDRHRYFSRHLVGFDVDPFGVEISRLALTLADFPNPNGWQITLADVFADSKPFRESLESAGVVLCNPPFEAFSEEERKHYALSAKRKPIELLYRVLEHLHPRGVLGFVLPQSVINGREYKAVRRKLADRFASIDITSLPDHAFEADQEVALIVAQRPLPHRAVSIRHRKVIDTPSAWRKFEWRHEVSSTEASRKGPDECAASVAIPELSEVWDYLKDCAELRNVAELHSRGIEWNLPLTAGGTETGNREKLISSVPKRGFVLGIPPEASVLCFSVPACKYLDVRPEHQRGNAYKHSWKSPKVFLNAVTKSRRGWRIAAFVDNDGLAGYQNITGVWSEQIDLPTLAAVLNGPIANAFIATREGKRHIKIETLNEIPIPRVSPGQSEEIRSSVDAYLQQIKAYEDGLWMHNLEKQMGILLKKIDAAVLSAYDLPPQLERRALDFFNGQSRAVPFTFQDYFPSSFTPCFPLRDYLADDFREMTAAGFRDRFQPPPKGIPEAFAKAREVFEDR